MWTHIMVVILCKIVFACQIVVFFRTSICFNEKNLPKQYDGILKKVLFKETNVCFTDTLSQFFRPHRMV